MLEVEQLVKSVAQQAHTKQFLSSLDSWASLLSKRSLGKRTEQSGEESTELSSTVDVARITQGIPGRIAVVARYNEDPSHGFVNGRNESGRYYGSSNGSLLQKYASDNNVEIAAKHIFETFLARDHVRPVRE